MIYAYGWKNNAKRKALYGREFIIISRFKMNSAWVKFLDNGQEECISRNAIRRLNGKLT